MNKEQQNMVYSGNSTGDEILKLAFRTGILFMDKMVNEVESGKKFLSNKETLDLIQACFKELRVKFDELDTAIFTAALLRELIRTGEKFLGGDFDHKSNWSPVTAIELAPRWHGIPLQRWHTRSQRSRRDSPRFWPRVPLLRKHIPFKGWLTWCHLKIF